ncbi:MAG TPA: BTAD domain-containing putative transcriptional regulator [Pseudonocardia sp.]|nr:BTAD domain-containing putative transcriptional regulator [Pseudonocardia sp.]
MRIGLLGALAVWPAGSGTADGSGTARESGAANGSGTARKSGADDGSGTDGGSDAARGVRNGVSAPGGALVRGLLARLALDVGRPVAVSTLVDDLWGTAPPDGAAGALQALVSRLRRALGAGVVRYEPAGYRLALAPEQVDAARFTELTAAARRTEATEPARARALLAEAAALWRGPALADLTDLPFAPAAADRLAEQRALAVESAARLALAAGEPDAELTALRDVLAGQPLREPTAALLARSLHAAGRRADALAVLDQLRTALADQLGVDPGPELTGAHLHILRTTPPPPPPAETTPPASRESGIPSGRVADSVSPGRRPPRTPTPHPGESLDPVGRVAGFRGPDPGPASPAPTGPALSSPGLSSFIGRDADLRRLHAALDGARLVTLIGPGGAGKTRLARETVATLGTRTVRLAELAPLGDAAALPAAVLAAVGGGELVLRAQDRPGEHAPDSTERLVAAVSGRPMVLVLDNCEHLVHDVAELAEHLLLRAPELRILATSREPLGVPGERLHPVDALAEPDAVALLAERAGAVRPDFALAPVRAEVTEICRRLDGQPLAIELAAARLRTLSPAEIVARLDDRFRLLTAGSRTAPDRHQSLRAVVAWSWDLLDDAERALARRLAVFAGGATLEALRQVCADPTDPPDGPPTNPPAEPPDPLDILAALVDKSLVQAVPPPDGTGPTRYRMLETIKAFAEQQLLEAGERDAVAEAHAHYFLALAEAADRRLRGPDQLVWMGRLRAESGNLLAALRHAISTRDAATALRLTAALGWFWVARGLFDEASGWLAGATELPGEAPAAARAFSLALLAATEAHAGELASARTHIATAIALIDEAAMGELPLLRLIGPIAALYVHGDDGPLIALSGLAGPERPDGRWLRAFATHLRAQYAENLGHLELQTELLRVCHEEFRVTGDRFGLGMTVCSLGEREELAGNLAAAAESYDEAVQLATELGNEDDQPQFRALSARAAARRGDPETARATLRLAMSAADQRIIVGYGPLQLTLVEVERLAGDLPAARAALRAFEAQPADERTIGFPQRDAIAAAALVGIETADGNLAAARAALRRAVASALTSTDGPVQAVVAEVAAATEVLAGDHTNAAALLGLATARRGTLDRGNPVVLATLAEVTEALGPAGVERAVRRGRAMSAERGFALLPLE